MIGEATISGPAPLRTGKPREAQGLSNALVFHPAARVLARWLARTPVSPNMVSIAGAAMVVAAGVLYARIGTLPAILAGFAIHLAWHVVDGADGDLARMTGRASPIGELVDGLCDYGGHIVLYLLLAASLYPAFGWAAWALAVAAGGSRIVQSIYAESRRRTYLWCAYAIPWLRTSGAPAGGAGVLARGYIAASRWLAAGSERVDAIVAGADPDTRTRIAALARAEGRRTLPLQVLLGANARTLLLGAAMLAGHAEAFFWAEIAAFNLVLLVSIAQQRRSAARIAAAIGNPAAGRGFVAEDQPGG